MNHASAKSEFTGTEHFGFSETILRYMLAQVIKAMWTVGGKYVVSRNIAVAGHEVGLLLYLMIILC